MTTFEIRSSRSGLDRRAQRTRAALLDAFGLMVRSVGYEAITPATLAEAANVGRSTFYEHFSNLDEVLAVSMTGLLAPIVASTLRPEMDPYTVGLVQHFWDNRKIGNAMLSGDARTIVLRLLTGQFETALAGFRADRGTVSPSTSPRLAAVHLASGTLALLGAWMSGQASGSAPQIAKALHDAGYAAACALSA